MTDEDDDRLALSHEITEAHALSVFAYHFKQASFKELTDRGSRISIKASVFKLASGLVEALLLFGHLLAASSSFCHLDLVQYGPCSAAGAIGAGEGRRNGGDGWPRARGGRGSYS